MDIYKSCIAKRLKEARLQLGISQKQLGILAGIDEHSASARMNQYEMGKHFPNFLTLQNIGKVLGCPAAYFYAEEDDIADIILLIGKLSCQSRSKVLQYIKALSFEQAREPALTEE